MSPDQRAILARCKKENLKPSEIAGEFLCHDLVEACLTQMRKISVAFKNLDEKGQDSAIAELTDRIKEATTDAIRTIMAAGSSAIPFKLKSLTIDGKLKVTGLVEGDHPERHALTDKAHDKSEILLILSPRDYFEGLETIQGEKNQKSFPLDDESPDPKAKETKSKPVAKAGDTGGAKNVTDIAAAVSFKPIELQKARDFCTQFRLPTIQGIQQAVACGFNKGEAILNELARLGEVVKNESGTFQMPPLAAEIVEPDADDDAGTTTGTDEPAAPEAKPTKPLTKAAQKKIDNEAAKARAEAKAAEVETSRDEPLEWGGELTDELYEKMKAKTIKDQKVSAGGLAIAFDCPITIADLAIDRMEMETVISEEDEMGQRECFDQPE